MTQQVLPYIKESGNVLAFTVGSADQLVIDADQEFMMKGNIYINTSNTALTGVDLSGHGLTSVTRYVRFTLSTLTFALSTDDSASTIDEMNCAKVVFDGSGIATVTAYANKGLEDNVEKTSRTQDYDMIIGDADEVASGVATHTTSGFIDGNLSNNDRILILDGTYDPGVVTISRTGLTVRCQSYSTVITTDDALTFSGNNCDIELPNVSNASNVSVSGTGSTSKINNEVSFEGQNFLDMLPPIGSIVGIDPNVNASKALDTNYWEVCDSTGGNITVRYRDGTTDNISRPNLSDSRFLMGGTATGTGGSNTIVDHTHGCGNQSASHTHSHNHAAQNSGNQSSSHKHNLLGRHTFSATGVGRAAITGEGSIYDVAAMDNQSLSHTHSTNLPNTASGNQSANHNHSIGSGSAPTSTSSLPLYFKVKYYMRKK